MNTFLSQTMDHRFPDLRWKIFLYTLLCEKLLIFCSVVFFVMILDFVWIFASPFVIVEPFISLRFRCSPRTFLEDILLNQAFDSFQYFENLLRGLVAEQDVIQKRILSVNS